MTVLFRLPPELRGELKRPLGELIRGPIPGPYLKVRERLARARNLVTVGDVVTENVLKLGVKPSIAIYDHRTERRDYKPDIEPDAVVITVQNPPGTITKELLEAIRKAYELVGRGKRVYIIVGGEEDLATIPAVLYASPGTLVVYGQPREGIVLIKVIPECKRRCAEIMRRMEVVRDGD
ncbi:GTP-dependent dephospho-CoA kinase [Pyrococcus yayanosii]|uniref:GTP-dependent dephospho-CoA kinase n=1 Tax=Pyrococcus yayanosii (strain CH1 / JCM 16557) TaxID=529709 RepID=F8AFN6_PYRYC|nr:GTP-dependent dephospho-CoA kinase [Pyrococcus yayanosii]AEH25006.1 hypothetical protein PYCH_13340 [Pyrococcus yayanosii CH1]